MSAPTPTRTQPPRVLVVDDEEPLRLLLRVILERNGYAALEATDGLSALAALDADPDIKLVLCDIRMPRMDGMTFLREAAGREGLRVVMMSAYGTTDTAVQALSAGAVDYVSKPFRADEIRIVLDRILDRDRLEDENRRLRETVDQQSSLEGFIGRSPGALEVMELVRRVAAYPSIVLFTGESGTGKELLARALHSLSPRADAPFVPVNCAAIPATLLESELFGHERGAFTGAVKARAGLFEQAHRGTLLLDEIGDMPLALQTRLLRVLEDGRVHRVGGEKDIIVDVRVVAATARDLDAAVKDGHFREDLYYRLNVVHVRIPPLRDRREDIPLLAQALSRAAGVRLGVPIDGVSATALSVLVAHDWPGNVRQLDNALERAVLMAPTSTIEVNDLPPELRAVRDTGTQPLVSPDGGVSDADLSIKARTAALERELILLALERTGGNRTQASKLLEISYKALVYKIRGYGLE